MNFEKLSNLTELLQKRVIGDPIWIDKKNVFEYSVQSVEVVAVLKAIRAVHGIKSMQILCEKGLFIDMGAIYRCVNDCCEEIHFLLEKYPKTSSDVDQFVKAFFESTIDNYLNAQTSYLPIRKIHSASVRILEKYGSNPPVRDLIRKIYKTGSGYIHAGYVNIMGMYGGSKPNFNLGGVPSLKERAKYIELVETASVSVSQAIAFGAYKFGLKDISKEILESLE